MPSKNTIVITARVSPESLAFIVKVLREEKNLPITSRNAAVTNSLRVLTALLEQAYPKQPPFTDPSEAVIYLNEAGIDLLKSKQTKKRLTKITAKETKALKTIDIDSLWSEEEEEENN